MKTYRVLTIRQPWAALIIDGVKPIENRTWQTDYRGPLLIHAAASRDRKTIEDEGGMNPDELIYGAVIGIVDLTDIVTDHPSYYFTGPYGWVLRRPRAVHPIPMRGQLSLYTARLKQLRYAR